ncbi:MAG: hypothetical protein GY854_12120 [Deltaproteobacteria bacterium]|nr:hypothetical protein [Deltaproteobacteria bacterium]
MMAIVLLVSLVLGVLGGWLVPIVYNSEPPYGLAGDILVCTIFTVVFSYLSWSYAMPVIGEDGCTKVLGSICHPFILGLISLGVMRWIKG